jgi:TetR/AcrR family transcriptional regulator, transcriptional repressor of aconitase
MKNERSFFILRPEDIMPKVTDAHREARREQILDAAMRCFAEKGFQRTSMADIGAASGLSAGAIYLQFAGKQQIALEAGRRVMSRRLGRLLGDDGVLHDPIETLELLLTGIMEDLPDAVLLVQLWGEATSDPEMSELVREIFGTLQSAWVGYLTAWARTRGVDDPAAWGTRTMPTVLALAQGFMLQRALMPSFDPEVYFASVRAVTGPQLLTPPAADPRSSGIAARASAVG